MLRPYVHGDLALSIALPSFLFLFFGWFGLGRDPRDFRRWFSLGDGGGGGDPCDFRRCFSLGGGAEGRPIRWGLGETRVTRRCFSLHTILLPSIQLWKEFSLCNYRRSTNRSWLELRINKPSESPFSLSSILHWCCAARLNSICRGLRSARSICRRLRSARSGPDQRQIRAVIPPRVCPYVEMNQSCFSKESLFRSRAEENKMESSLEGKEVICVPWEMPPEPWHEAMWGEKKGLEVRSRARPPRHPANLPGIEPRALGRSLRPLP